MKVIWKAKAVSRPLYPLATALQKLAEQRSVRGEGQGEREQTDQEAAPVLNVWIVIRYGAGRRLDFPHASFLPTAARRDAARSDGIRTATGRPVAAGALAGPAP